jgi:mono/diheme cytochrome c family protein
MAFHLARPAWAIALLLAACSSQNPLEAVTAPPSPEAGHMLYERTCAECHGADGRGNGPRAAALDPPPGDLTLLAWRNGGTFPKDRLIAVLSGEAGVTGHDTNAMPVWQSLARTPESSAGAAAAFYQTKRLDEVAAYLETLQRSGPGATAP